MAYKKADDYVEVAERLMEFYGKYPDGRITRQGDPLIVGLPQNAPPEKQKPFVIYTALAYRTPDDPIPAIGTAWEPWPGPTPYTKDSELMNAETSAWGRAIIATGISAKKGIASKEEVLARTGHDRAFPSCRVHGSGPARAAVMPPHRRNLRRASGAAARRGSRSAALLPSRVRPAALPSSASPCSSPSRAGRSRTRRSRSR